MTDDELKEAEATIKLAYYFWEKKNVAPGPWEGFNVATTLLDEVKRLRALNPEDATKENNEKLRKELLATSYRVIDALSN